ncbi:MAG: diguanylate cyclase [bacterium]|nr:diguanylate cyclase [bacterium]
MSPKSKNKKGNNKMRTILIADDSPTMRLMLEEILVKECYNVLCAEDGVQAAEMAFQHIPDMIISDIEMPRMNGYQVCRLLKNDPLTRNTPVIILTSRTDSGSVFWGYQTGADLYILKDFQAEELTATISKLFSEYEKKLEPKLPGQKVETFQIMEKLNNFLDDRLFEMTLINQINQTTFNLTSIHETVTQLLTILDKAIENHIIGFVVFSNEKDILLSIKLNETVPRKLLEIFQYQALEDLAISVNKDITEYNIDVEVMDFEEKQLTDEDIQAADFDPHLIYSIPIRARDETLGILNVYHPQMPTVSLYQKNLLEKLAPYLSTTIGAVLMYNKIKGLSVIDGLTQLYNRRYIMELFKTEFSKTVRYDSDLSLLMIDIDDFKKINDTHGHLSGDIVLKSLSAIIKKNLRNVDLPGRYGGEEFIVILPETTKENAMVVAERIRVQVLNNTFKTMNGEPVSVTISLGIGDIADLDNKTNELELIKIADSRLYNAKRTGKNKVVDK